MGLFSGKPESNPSQITPSPAPEPPAPVSKGTTPRIPTVIDKDAVIKGEISSRSDMLIEGRVEGKIRGAKRVVIGESGNVQAQVYAEVVSVRGEVHGDCEATNKVEITETGKIFGNISAQAIVVAEGATFRGASKMTKASQPKPVTSKGASTQTRPPSGSPPAPRAG